MSHQNLSSSREKRKKQQSIGTTDPDPSSTPNISTTSHPKRARLGPAPHPSTSTGTEPPAQTPTDNSSIGPVAQVKKGRIGWSMFKSWLGKLESGTNAVGPLRSAISELINCVELCEGSSEARKDYNELQTWLERLKNDLTAHESQSIGPVMTNSVKQLCADIEAELKNIEEQQARNTGRRLVDAIDTSEEIQGCYRRIAGNLERLTFNTNVNILEAINEQTAPKKESRLAKIYPAMSAIYNSAESDDIRRGNCTPGTREPQIEFLLEWARNPQAGRTCWINGMAGTGKTTIAYTVCSRLDKTFELGASFFCSRVIPECRQVKYIIPTIAYQLARFSLPFRCALVKVLESDPDAHTRALKVQYQKLMVEPLSKLEVKDSLPTCFIVVIDALDECENENSLDRILDLLLSPTNACSIKVLVSSRPEPEIYRRMMVRVEGQNNAKLVLHDLDADAVRSDISAYMKHELDDIPLDNAQWSGLLERCGVLFIYASSTCRYLNQAHNMGTLDEAVAAIIGSGSMPIESGDENAIDELYLTILTAAFSKSGMSQANKGRMGVILETVICAAEPMTLDVLTGVLGLGSSKQARGLLQPLRSVLNVNETTGLVTTLHASFPEFMLSQDRSKRFHCILGTRHVELAEACLQMIEAVEPKFNICGLRSSYMLDNEVENLNKRVSQAISPGLLYACRYWSSHICLGEYRDKLVDLVRNFFIARLLLWMEILNLTQCMRFGTSIVRDAGIWNELYLRMW
ncbi:unnamed protein product [Rhizoctonia solani]|uniref:NACHT domain-containing protein n=1 Tax=Rhizoctonia solani TaxID=456999 RepID=A0A8H3CWU7_9AGAM|nr:unnamed protein product [Rhizoctonia solani]